MWELLAGSILAYFEINNGYRSKNKTFNFILPTTGLFLIAHSIIFFNDEMFHPSFYTLSPIIGVCLIIWFSHKDELLTKILSTNLFVGIGLISYSLYLWHYPIFAFSRITIFTDANILKKLFLVSSLFILSITSYFFVEKPFRNKQNKFKKIFISLLIVILTISAINIYVIFKDGKIGYSYKFFQSVYLKNSIFNKELRAESWRYINNSNFQEFQSKEKVKILLVGDSHAKDLFNAFVQNINLFKNYEFLRYGDQHEIYINFGEKRLNKKDFIKFNESKIFKQSDIIIISDYFNSEDSFDKLDIFLDMFKDKKKIILTSSSNIYINPQKKLNLHLTLFDEFLLKNNKDKKFIDKNLDFDERNKINNYYYENRDLNKINKINTQLKIYGEKYNIQILYKEQFQCDLDRKICFGVTDEGIKSHYDYGHFTLEGAKFFGKRIYDINWLKIN